MKRLPQGNGTNRAGIGGWLLAFLPALAILVPFLFAYSQYVEQTIHSRIDRTETAFAVALDQLQASSAAVRAAGIRTLYAVAFRQVLEEPQPAWYGPARNLFVLWRSHRERHLLNRSRTLFKEYMRADRQVSPADEDLISTVLARTAYDWIVREESLGTMGRKSPEMWFFQRAVLAKARFTNKDLRDMSMAEVNFQDAMLQGTIFSGAWMPGANLRGVDATSAYFVGAGLLRADMRHADFRFSQFNSADLSYAVADSADFTVATIENACLVEFQGIGATFRNARLRNTWFRDADLRGADFAGADLALADFSGADLRGADMSQAVSWNQVRSWEGANLTGAILPSGFAPGDRQMEPHNRCPGR